MVDPHRFHGAMGQRFQSGHLFPVFDAGQLHQIQHGELVHMLGALGFLAETRTDFKNAHRLIGDGV
jgi:hypothetical protein